MDELTVRVESSATGDFGHLGATLATRVKDAVGVSISVEVAPPHSLARSLGKAKRIEDQRPR